MTERDVHAVVLAVYALAEEAYLSSAERQAITTAASELAWNAYKYAERGEAYIQILKNKHRMGIEVVIEDKGPGIADTTKVLEQSSPSRKSLGLGLSGAKRLSDEFTIESQVGVGTKVRVVKWGKVIRD